MSRERSTLIALNRVVAPAFYALHAPRLPLYAGLHRWLPFFAMIRNPEKLELLTKYLRAYVTIFTRNPQARFFHTVYVDAFAGAGYIRRPQRDTSQTDLFEDLAADDDRRIGAPTPLPREIH